MQAFQALASATYPPVSGTTAAAIPYDTVTVGSISNLDEGMVVIVSPVPDPRSPYAIRLLTRFDAVAGAVADGTNIIQVNLPLTSLWLILLHSIQIIRIRLGEYF